ncbi:MAG: Fur family transcriptional regulator [SAR202 cluster bacterium]|jgi:Fur family peroxide stress response transcriptional regulator|nr:Fur family transcriptional regulator [SAR202 cluster bacterium]MDP6513594.1 Fur family transcriptional regulator [SAR202 cluster bacterium]MDP6716718.1 Fur family transcriptional regulator [SAR202 cluster bacterium]
MSPDTQERLEEMRSALVQRGVVITPKRAKVLEILAGSDDHPNVGDLHAEVQRWHPSTSLATVYNTIELLKETGQVLELEFSASANRYDGRRPDSHPHLVCVECQRIDDLDVPESKGMFEAIGAETGYEVVRQRLDYYGICPNCQKKREARLSR